MSSTDQVGPMINTRMVVRGAVLVAVGGLLAGVGMAIGGVATMSAAREWVRRLDTPPSETGKAVVRKISAATNAGADEWRKRSATS